MGRASRPVRRQFRPTSPLTRGAEWALQARTAAEYRTRKKEETCTTTPRRTNTALRGALSSRASSPVRSDGFRRRVWTGIDNLAPYSQFQNLGFDPPFVMFSANQGEGKEKGFGHQCRRDGTVCLQHGNLRSPGRGATSRPSMSPLMSMNLVRRGDKSTVYQGKTSAGWPSPPSSSSASTIRPSVSPAVTAKVLPISSSDASSSSISKTSIFCPMGRSIF